MADHFPIYSLWVTGMYSFLCSFPFITLATYSFRDHWRFGKRVTLSLVSAVFVIQFFVMFTRIQFPFISGFWLDVLTSVSYVIFIFVVFKEHIGKLIFTVLVLSELGDFMVTVGKCLEALFFPKEALLVYYFTYPLFMTLVLSTELPIVYLLIFRDLCTHGEAAKDSSEKEKVGGYMWRYLWLIPAVFYLIGKQNFYSFGSSVLENIMNPARSIYLLIVDAGSILIYRVIIQTVGLYEKNSALQAENHTLLIQRLQYDSLNDRLENMRRTKHDIRHHAALLKEIRDSGDISKLDDLIAMYTEENLLDQPLIFCENETINVVLALYSETAAKYDIAFSVKADLPKDVFVAKEHLVVLFGNLLENAADACKEISGKRFIDLTAAYSETPSGMHCLSLIVKNSFKNVSRDETGIFHSTKHEGDGIGISSVKSITEKYGGACSFAPEDGVFTVSVILYG